MSNRAIRVALVGMGKIARDQHIPAIAGNPNLELVATVNPGGEGIDDIPHYASIEEMLAQEPGVDAVALCSPPQVRYGLAAAAIAARRHVFLEKPPAATLSEVAVLHAQAATAGVTLFAGWHSRFAAGVEPARAWLAERSVVRATITWREDVRHWHPGQGWIWEAGGLGVFDPGINALSIATHILPRPLVLEDAILSSPSNRDAPIAAELSLRDSAGAPVTMDLDWRQTGPQTWDIEVETDAGNLKLSQGGAILDLPTGTRRDGDSEYAGLYARFVDLIGRGESDVDVTPLQLVADAFLRGRHAIVDAFED